jgi:hypothetical protein
MVAGKYRKAQNMSLKKDIKPDFLREHGFNHKEFPSPLALS